ncbi:MAG: hypothetical protein CFK52_02805 [Chloracidobacterium sp. CP2_5A]|nr:MAG: hypothetical protein CFK52_02805 [Chloracidobacterium sp. CP2_5A]
MQTGLDRLFTHHLDLLRDRRVGLICSPASVDVIYRHAADLFAACPAFRLTALFGPQHGLRGETQDNMIEWEGWARDSRLGIPVFSLYGQTRQPTPEMLAEVDALVFDVPDVGTRVYTFIWTMALAMQAAKARDIPFVVLDRPNPIGGLDIEGAVLEREWASFVGMYPLPMRHAMTVGELARLFNETEGIGCELRVVPMEGWSRPQWFDATWLPWVMPSPNMPTLDTAAVYPGLVLLEGTTLSEGRGTTRPFEIFGAPFIDPYDLAAALDPLHLPGVHFRPMWFQPTFNKFAGQLCGGLQAHVQNRATFRSYRTAVEILKAVRRLYPREKLWRDPPYEYVFDRLPFDVIAGSSRLRAAIEADAAWEDIAAADEPALADFYRRRAAYLLY